MSRDPEKKRAYDKAYNAARRKETKSYNKAYHAAHPEEQRARARAYRASHVKEIQARMRVYAQTHRKESRVRNLAREYGLTLGAFNDLVDGQGGVCAACGSSDWGFRGPKVDHNHATGKVRGILCHRCNLAAGWAKDNPEILRRLAAYLERT